MDEWLEYREYIIYFEYIPTLHSTALNLSFRQIKFMVQWSCRNSYAGENIIYEQKSCLVALTWHRNVVTNVIKLKHTAEWTSHNHESFIKRTVEATEIIAKSADADYEETWYLRYATKAKY